ncbi:MAG TPA: hypothetical protein VN962_07195 [Polyangia bacterium]|nr:hypothetical protein [Polyangia bacterium]
MAGKTFPGIGDLEDESLDPADGADSGGTPAASGAYYSGPTVVDDAKLEASLQKVRSLDAPLTEVTGPEDTARELVESGAHDMPSFTPPLPKDGGRGTFIGRSVAEPAAQPPPEKPFDDRMRGTLYGHMLHLPELNLPAPEEPSSRELTIVDRSAPTSHAVEVYDPEAARRALAVPQEAEAFPRSDRYRSIPIEIEAETSNKTFVRVGIAAAAIAAIVGAAIIWVHTSTDEPEVPARPAAVAQPVAPPPAPIVVPNPPAAVPTTRDTAEAPPVEAPAPKPGRDGVRPSAERARTLAVRPATTPPATTSRPEHHRSSRNASDEVPAALRIRAPKPSHPAAAEDDPDGTLAPTIQ